MILTVFSDVICSCNLLLVIPTSINITNIKTCKYRMEGKVGELTCFKHLAKESLAN